MLHINRVTLLGHAGRGPDVRTLPDGGKTASFSLATARKWRREDGEAIESAEWHRMAVHGAAAKAAEDMVREGMLNVLSRKREPAEVGQ